MRYLGAPCTLPYLTSHQVYLYQLPQENLWACMSSGRSALEAGLTSGSAHVKSSFFIFQYQNQYSFNTLFYEIFFYVSVIMIMIMIMIILKTNHG